MNRRVTPKLAKVNCLLVKMSPPLHLYNEELLHKG